MSTPATRPNLAVVEGGQELKKKLKARPQTASERIAKLLAEAHELANEDVKAFVGELIALENHAHAIALGGLAYKVGVKEEARQIEAYCGEVVQRLCAIQNR